MKKILLSVIIFGAILRFIFPNVPPSLNWDETSLGYNAYSILKTGKDEWGRFLPISFEAFGDYKLPGYVYTDVPFVGLFGLNEAAVRLPSQLAGVISILLIYLIVDLLLNENAALVSALLLAVSPWHIFLSRIGVEANLSFAFFLCGLYFFLKGLEKHRYLILSAIFYGLTLFTYNSARVFIPLFIITSVIIYRENLLNKKNIIAGVVFGAFLTLAFYQAVLVDSNARYFWVAILDQGAINYLNQARNTSHLYPLLVPFVYNRVTFLGVNVIKNYLSHFSLSFLFLNGGSNYQFSLPGHGLLYIFELPFIILGLTSLKGKESKLLLAWLLIAPIPSAITREAPHALRAIYMLGSLQVITALGLIKLAKYSPKRYLIGICLIAYALGLSFYLKSYFLDYPRGYSQAWQYGMEQVIESIKNEPGKVYITKQYGEPHIFYLFFTQYDPARYQNNPTLVRYSRSNWRWVDKLDNVTFINDWEIKDRLKHERDAVLVTSPGNYPPQFKLEKRIYFLDGSPAFDILATRE